MNKRWCAARYVFGAALDAVALVAIVAGVSLSMAGRRDVALSPVAAGSAPQSQPPTRVSALLPTANVADPTGCPGAASPTTVAGPPVSANAARPAGDAAVVAHAGWLDDDGPAQWRLVGVALDGQGGLQAADDVGNRVRRVSVMPAP